MDVPSEFYTRYFERRKHDLECCLHSLEGDNYSVLEKTGHQLKGSAATFGFPELAQVGHELEAAARKKDKQQMERAIQKL